jgi:hypothetical protein
MGRRRSGPNRAVGIWARPFDVETADIQAWSCSSLPRCLLPLGTLSTSSTPLLMARGPCLVSLADVSSVGAAQTGVSDMI